MLEGQTKAIRRVDYSAPAYWIETVDLTFDLDPTKTRVLNKMRVRRNPDVAAQALRLDGEELNLTTRLNGQVMQHATTAMLIFPIPRLIEYVSTFTTLAPGDVIVSGTPGGVGARRKPPVWMKEGDQVEIEVSKIGVLSNRVEKEKI